MRGAIRRAQTQGLRGGFAPFLPSPFSLMRRMAEDMDRVLQDLTLGRNAASQNTSVASPFERDQWSGTSAATQTAWMPPVEIFKRDDKIVTRAELPGLKKEDVNVEVDNGMLVISGERCDDNEDSRDGFYRSERVYGQFYRAIPLPEGVDADHCEASFKDGVLEVTFPAPRPQERKTQVNIR
jgi:HSP20 family protein